MKYYHIVPKGNLYIPLKDGESVRIERISTCLADMSWRIVADVPCGADAVLLEKAVRDTFAITGSLQIERVTVDTLERDGEALDVTDTVDQADDFSSDDMEGYSIPYEDIYDEDEELYDEAYRKACKAARTSGEERRLKKKRNTSLSAETADGRVLLGKVFSTAEIPGIGEILGDERNNIVLRGKIVKVEFKELKSKRILLAFQIADKTNGISAKTFIDTGNSGKFGRKNALTDEQLAVLKKTMEVNTFIYVHGNVRYDNYQNDYVLNADAIMTAESNVVERVDENPTPRVELHLHTTMSDMDALITVKDLIRTVKKWNHPAVAVTDHGVVQSFPALQEMAAANDVKVIYGMEGYLFDNEIDKSYHIIILAKNQIGLRNLYKLVSISHLKYIYRGRPRIPRAVLNEYREGLILGSACEAGELIRSMVQKRLAYDELKKVASYYDYLEIQPICNNEFLVREGYVDDDEGLREINRTILKLGDELGKLTVATCDAHFLNKEDKIYREILMTGKGFKDAEFQPDLYLRTTDEMIDEFSYLGEERAREVVITNPNKINAMIDAVTPVPKANLYFPRIEGASEALKQMCLDKAHKIYGTPLPAVVETRLNEEFTSIFGNGFGVLYYIAHKLVKHSNDDGYLVGSRGSVGSSFVATMADITEVNPLPPHYVCPACRYSEFFEDGSVAGGFDLPDKPCPVCGTPLHKDGHNIPFAVFLGFEGDKVPDIDLNFSGEYHPKAHKYTEELFGKDNVFRAGTIGAVKDKTAFGYVKKWAEARGITANDAYINSLVNGCTGIKNTTGQHPGGVMVIPRDIDIHHFTPVQYPANKKDCGIITTHFDYHSIEGRLVKLDILGHDDPTVIRMLEDMTGIKATTVPFDDPQTMSLFSSTEALGLTPEELGSPVGSLGIPEFGTSFVRKMLVDTRPKTFSGLVRISGFSHGTDVWLNNAQELITSGTATLNEAVSARDDIMNYLINHGVKPKTSFKVMENVRKGNGIDKPEKATGRKTTDYEGELRKNNIPEWFIQSCSKIGYLFPRAHAVAYVMMAFRIAWYKINQPLAYYAAFFTVRAKAFSIPMMVHGLDTARKAMKVIAAKGDNATKIEEDLYTTLELVVEMNLRGISFLNIDINKSDATKFIICDGKILLPFTALDGLGKNVAEQIVAAREEQPYSSKEDLKYRGKVGQTLIDALAEQGCLGELPEDEQLDLFAI